MVLVVKIECKGLKSLTATKDQKSLIVQELTDYVLSNYEKFSVAEKLKEGGGLRANIINTIVDDNYDRYLSNKPKKSPRLEKEMFFKICGDISRSFHDFNGLEEAIKQGEFKFNKIEFVADNKSVHAEMKMLDHFVDKWSKEKNTEESGEEKERLYIGISKICCGNCSCAIKAANEFSNKNIESGFSSSRETHGNTYSNWKAPNFLTGEIKLRYGELVAEFEKTESMHGGERASKSDSSDGPPTLKNKIDDAIETLELEESLVDESDISKDIKRVFRTVNEIFTKAGNSKKLEDSDPGKYIKLLQNIKQKMGNNSDIPHETL